MPYGLKVLGRYKGRLDAEWMLPQSVNVSATLSRSAIMFGFGWLLPARVNQLGSTRRLTALPVFGTVGTSSNSRRGPSWNVPFHPSSTPRVAPGKGLARDLAYQILPRLELLGNWPQSPVSLERYIFRTPSKDLA
jgi:hypothetical protein